MTETWTRLRASALDAVGALKELLADPGAEDRRLVAGYLEAKQALAHAFEAFAVEKYADVSVLEGVRKDIEQQMRESYPRLPAKYLKVRGFGKSHARLVAYLVRSSGNEVSAVRAANADRRRCPHRAPRAVSCETLDSSLRRSTPGAPTSTCFVRLSQTSQPVLQFRLLRTSVATGRCRRRRQRTC